ncbi:MAG: O-antigen ligase family protein [Leptolyngbya sp. SIO3F4]|nr:O-antigen ligase family protein [Leptolyngbya sp. SIO3F4]
MKTFSSKNLSLYSSQATVSLLRGWQIRWQALTLSEKVVCANIVLIPLWWIAGLYRYWALLLCFGILCHDYLRYRKLQLRRPNFMVACLLLFCTYQCIGLFLFSLSTSLVNVTTLIRTSIFWFPPAFILWYAKSNNIKVRFEVIAWACSVLAFEMFVFWLAAQAIFKGNSYDPPRTIFSLLVGNASGSYASGKGLENYLIPYAIKEKDVSIIFGLPRWNFFFVTPETGAIVSAFLSLVALDISQRRWSISLLFISLFFVLMGGTRSIWLGLPLVIIMRCSITLGKNKKLFIPLAVLAFISFSFLAVPTITAPLAKVYSEAFDSVSSYRGTSTDVRGEIYLRTLEAIPNRLFWGHWVRGESVLAGSELARVGSHSFILSSLLYRLGLVGTSLFLLFWLALVVELFRTLSVRPLFAPCVITLYCLLSIPMEFGVMPSTMIVLLSTLVYQPNSKTFPSRVHYA